MPLHVFGNQDTVKIPVSCLWSIWNLLCIFKAVKDLSLDSVAVFGGRIFFLSVCLKYEKYVSYGKEPCYFYLKKFYFIWSNDLRITSLVIFQITTLMMFFFFKRKGLAKSFKLSELSITPFWKTKALHFILSNWSLLRYRLTLARFSV